MQRLPVHVLAVIALAGFVAGLVAASSSLKEAQAADSRVAPDSYLVEREHSVELSRRVSSQEMAGQMQVLLDRTRLGNHGLQDQAALRRAIERWLFADPARCIAWLWDHNATGLVSPDLLPDVFASAMAGDLVAGIRFGGDIHDPNLRAAWLHSIFDVAKQASPQQAMDLLTYLPPKIQKEVGLAVISTWAASDGRAAWSAVVEGTRPHQNSFAAEVIKNWVTVDAAGMQFFMRSKLSNPRNGREREILPEALFIAQSPDTSLPILNTLAGIERDPVVQGLWWVCLSAVKGESADQALRVIDQEPLGAPRYAARAEIASGLIHDYPEEALSIVDALPGFESRKDLLTTMIASNLERSREKEAAILSQKQTEPLLRAELMAMVATVWVREDVGSFLQFVLEQEEERATAWFDRLSESNPDHVETGKLDEGARAKLHRELSARLPPEKAAEMLERFYRR